MQNTFEDLLTDIGEVGFVERVVSAVALCSGLPGAKVSEVVRFESGELGRVATLMQDQVEILVFSQNSIKVGTRVARLGYPMAVSVGEHLLGTTIDALGIPLSGGVVTGNKVKYKVEVVPVGIMKRTRIKRPMETGVVLIDLLIPLGMGQRELIIGDRKTGKSQMVFQAILAQARAGSVCIYAAIGKKRTEIKRFEEFVKANGVAKNTIIIAASSQDSTSEVYISPYTAMAVAEYFRDTGRDVLIVLDDMSTHAKFYRELSLLSRKFPGRDSYPGDIFHVHSSLMERSGNFKLGDGEVSITCLPVAETVQGDLSGYIQTNLMSMTDGHILFDAELFFRGRRPAIDPFLSVTRVGHQTQTKLRREISQQLVSLLNSYDKTQGFLRFGAELGENSRQILDLGDKVYAFFDQPLLLVVPIKLQIVLIAMIWSGLWNGKGLEKIVKWHDSSPDGMLIVANVVDQAPNWDKLLAGVREKADYFTKVVK